MPPIEVPDRDETEQGPRAKLYETMWGTSGGSQQNPCSSSEKVIVGTVSVHVAALLENGNSRECPSLLKGGKVCATSKKKVEG